jgi:hypothetical protein
MYDGIEVYRIIRISWDLLCIAYNANIYLWGAKDYKSAQSLRRP